MSPAPRAAPVVLPFAAVGLAGAWIAGDRFDLWSTPSNAWPLGVVLLATTSVLCGLLGAWLAREPPHGGVGAAKFVARARWARAQRP